MNWGMPTHANKGKSLIILPISMLILCINNFNNDILRVIGGPSALFMWHINLIILHQFKAHVKKEGEVDYYF